MDVWHTWRIKLLRLTIECYKIYGLMQKRCNSIAYAPNLHLISINSLRSRQNGNHLTDDVFKRIFLNENVWSLLQISLKFVPKVPINNIPALVQIMACHRPGDKPLSKPMMVNLLTHICVAQPQWVNSFAPWHCDSDFKSIISAHRLQSKFMSTFMKLLSDYRTAISANGNA